MAARTVEQYIRAGVAGAHLEDQVGDPSRFQLPWNTFDIGPYPEKFRSPIADI